MSLALMHPTATVTFGTLLKQLRKRGGMTQRDLAAALGYSDSLISSLERGQRQPDIQTILSHFIPALGLQNDPATAKRMVESAAAARGEKLPPLIGLEPTALSGKTTRSTKPISSIPVLPTELVGRDVAIQQISNRLLGHSGRLLTLVGPPGVGKTTLALAVATQIQQSYADGAYFVPLATVNDATLMSAKIVSTLSPGDSSTQPPQNRLVQLLRQQALLLVLDNLEQIPDAAPLIATLLAQCPQVTILATSRERLHLRAEQRFLVLPLDASDAVELFIQRAQAINIDFMVSREIKSSIQLICRRLSYLPLAIELSAAWVHALSCEEIAAEIKHNLHFPTTNLRDLPERHRSLFSVFDHSWNLLTPEEQTAFARLSVFRGKFTQEAAALVADITFPILSSLIDKSLLYRNQTSDYEMHEYGRQFAAAKLKGKGESSTIQQRHEIYFSTKTQKDLQNLRSTLLPIQEFTSSALGIQNKTVIDSAMRMQPKRGISVLMLSWEYPPYVIGGRGKHVTELVPTLSQSIFREGQVKIDLLTTCFAGGQVVEQLSPTLTIYRMDMPEELRYPFADAIPNQTLLTQQATKLIQDKNYDLIHIQDWRVGPFAIDLKRNQNVPLVATYHAFERARYQNTLPGNIDQIENLEREIAHEATHIIVCSHHMSRDIQSHFGVSAEKVSVTPNGIRTKARDHYPSQEQKILRQQHAPLGQNLLFFIGSALHEKGLSVLIRAMPYILSNHPNTRLVVAGKQCDKLLPLAYELDVEKAIDFLGYISDQHRDALYHVVDALIIPSLYEPFGIVALEAMALGCNVIASDVGGLGEVVRHLDNGLTTQPDNPQSIANAVNLLFTNPAAAQQLRERALGDIRTIYQWEKIATQTIQVYENLI